MSTTETRSTPATLVAALVLAAASVAGCTGTTSTPAASGSSDAAPQAAETTAENSHSEEAGLPEWFVGEFPVHPDLRLDRTRSNEPEQFAYYFTGGADRIDEMYDWFSAQYSNNGWKIVDRYDNRHAFNAEKAGGYEAQVHVTGLKNVTTIVSLRGSITP